jgi:cell division inhibitor SepF
MPTFVRRAMVYLGLTDDDYDDFDEYEEESEPEPGPRQVRAWSSSDQPEPQQSTIRAFPREEQPHAPATVRPTVVRAVPQEKPRVHVAAPARFADAQEIGDRFRDNQPVIVNLQLVDRDLSRRMIDFCSGITYALGGSMEKVADQVFLLTPSNVEVSAEERQHLSQRGLYRS